MKKVFLWMLPLLLAACSQPKNWDQAMQSKMKRYASFSHKQLEPKLEKAGITGHPEEIALLVFKDHKTMELYAKSSPIGAWHYVKTYPVLAASGHLGPKLQEGDRQVPEGIYHIKGLNPNSHFDLSMQLNYPNTLDETFASLDNRHRLGGNIFIHGDKKSIGCLAIGNKGIRELFPLVYQTGMRHVEVIIAPTDFRHNLPLFADNHPSWLPVLYQQINQALIPFSMNPHQATASIFSRMKRS